VPAVRIDREAMDLERKIKEGITSFSWNTGRVWILVIAFQVQLVGFLQGFALGNKSGCLLRRTGQFVHLLLGPGAFLSRRFLGISSAFVP